LAHSGYPLVEKEPQGTPPDRCAACAIRRLFSQLEAHSAIWITTKPPMGGNGMRLHVVITNKVIIASN
ncbi:hypothetical protein PJM52_29325, partial [Mycobacterium kansasii]